MLVATTGKSRIGKKTVTSRIVTMRIQEKYLEKISRGEKKTEYRSLNEYYSKLFLHPFHAIKLHFQTSRQIIVAVKALRIETHDDEDFFCLDLGEILSQTH